MCIDVSGTDVRKFILASDSLIARLAEEVDRAAFVEDWFTFCHGYVVAFTAHPFRAHIALDQVHIFLVTVFKVTRKFIIRGLPQCLFWRGLQTKYRCLTFDSMESGGFLYISVFSP